MSHSAKRKLWALIAAGTAIRLVIIAVSHGYTFDMDSLRIMASAVAASPLHAYSSAIVEGTTRWPYPPGFLPWLWFCHALVGSGGHGFSMLVRVPAIVADALIALIVQDFLGRRGQDERRRLLATALVMLAPAFGSISAYHGQIDAVGILPAVAALWCWEYGPEARRWLICGILVGLAFTIKTIPAVVVLGLLPSARTRREGLQLIAAAAVVAIVALAPFALSTPHDVVTALRYRGLDGFGGLSLLVQPNLATGWLTGANAPPNSLTTVMINHGSLIAIAALAVLAVVFWYRRPTATAGCAIAFLTVYALGVNFFLQYLVWGLPFFLMAGYLGWVAIVELIAIPPMLIFYANSGNTPLVWIFYIPFMLALWALAAYHLYRAAAANGHDPLGAVKRVLVGIGSVLSRRLGFMRTLIGIAAVAFLIRAVYVLAGPHNLAVGGDFEFFRETATLISHGHGMIFPAYAMVGRSIPTAAHPPLWPYLLAAGDKLGLTSTDSQRLISSLCGSLTVITVGWIGRRIAGPRAGIIAGVLAAIFPVLISTDSSLMSEPLDGLLLSAAVLAGYQLYDTKRKRWAVVCGVMIGLAALVRAEGLVLLLFLLVPAVWRHGSQRWALIAVAAVSTAVVIAPWTIRNEIKFHQFVLVATDDGSLEIGANCNLTYYGKYIGFWATPCLTKQTSTNEAVMASRWVHMAATYAENHLSRLPAVEAVRLLRTAGLWDPVGMASFAEGQNIKFARWAALSYFLFAALALAGLWVAWRRRIPIFGLLSLIGITVLITLTGYGYPRFRHPADLAIVVLGAIAVDAWLGQRAEGAVSRSRVPAAEQPAPPDAVATRI